MYYQKCMDYGLMDYVLPLQTGISTTIYRGPDYVLPPFTGLWPNLTQPNPS
jgi:hypothetical protein